MTAKDLPPIFHKNAIVDFTLEGETIVITMDSKTFRDKYQDEFMWITLAHSILGLPMKMGRELQLRTHERKRVVIEGVS